MASVEEKVEDFYKEQLKGYKVRCFGKTESMNTDIDNALKSYSSKSGGTEPPKGYGR